MTTPEKQFEQPLEKRADLLALTLDDLMVLSNRGLVKRAQKEIAKGVVDGSVADGSLTYDLVQTEEVLQFTWSDEVVCRLPVGEVLCDRHCNCNATTLCRHLIRSVLTYQSMVQDTSQEKPLESSENSDLETTTVQSDVGAAQSLPVWNPGDISDEEIREHFRPAQFTKLKKEFSKNQVIEVSCGHKPTAQLHSFPHTLRFLVPGDLRYTYCDCDYDAPCPHVPLAIWAFRQLDENQQSGIISTESADAAKSADSMPTLSVPTELLDDIESALCDLVTAGLQGLSPGFMASLQLLEQRCDRAYLIWPANILADLFQSLNFYRNRDARFSLEQVITLVGELCMRCDAIRSNTGASPQLFIRGPHRKQLTDLGATRLIGLGCRVHTQHKSFTLNAYFQDTSSGRTLALSSASEPLPTADTQLDYCFWQTAQRHGLKQSPWDALGAGQLLIKRGSCSPSYQLQLKRNQSVVVNPQRFDWEKLRAPVLVDDLLELQQRLCALPPKALRPRRLDEDFYVLVITRVEQVAFLTVEQAVTAVIYDAYGQRSQLFFPYTRQASDGTEALLFCLSHCPIHFVSGQVTMHSGQMTIAPTAVVFEQAGRRQILQPWIYNAHADVFADVGTGAGSEILLSKQQVSVPSSKEDLMQVQGPVKQYLEEVSDAITSILPSGLDAGQAQTSKQLQALAIQGDRLGFSQTACQPLQLSERLDDSVRADVLAMKYLNILVLCETLNSVTSSGRLMCGR
ncbi:MAG: hypothetical protein AAFQ63_18225 [Cyanobacteria bacterium J06621_11]